MRVTFIKTKEIKDVNDSYGMRLIEQGKAVPAPQASQPPKVEEEAEAHADEMPRKKR